ncbi:MAG: YlmC/YmxH family sporulation protein [Bacillota bacterium]|nr:YlmC/YmxH family sporulation protein [Bacillota bacterium]
MMKISELQGKDIINCADGRYLGSLRDIEIDLTNGRVSEIFVNAPINGRRKKREPLSVPWQEIKKIGFDVILIESIGPQVPLKLLEERNPR